MALIRQQNRRSLITRVISAAAGLALVIYAAVGIVNFNKDIEQKQITAVRASVQKAVVHCYSIEGSYPPNLEYLQKNYGLILDKQHYVYDYRVFGSNIQPDIFIFRKS